VFFIVLDLRLIRNRLPEKVGGFSFVPVLFFSKVAEKRNRKENKKKNTQS